MFDPIRTDRHLRGLHRLGLLTHAQLAIATTMLWDLRARGRDESQVGYDRIAAIARAGRRTVAGAVQQLRALGVLTWRQTRLRVVWGGGEASRQWRNVYRWLANPRPLTECSQGPAGETLAKKRGGIERVWRVGTGICQPVRSVAQQLALLEEAERLAAGEHGQLVLPHRAPDHE